MCDNQHFVLLVAAGLEYGLITGRPEAEAVGQMLADANAASMAARYDDLTPDESNPAFVLTETTEGRLHPGWALKAVACWDYQSCEYDGHATSDARAWCDRLESAIRERHPGAVPGGPVWDFTGRLADAVTS